MRSHFDTSGQATGEEINPTYVTDIPFVEVSNHKRNIVTTF
jgi:hypothetical protein